MAEETSWFKGNLHGHSFWSDGYGFPEMIADWFKRQGYHFLALSEHDRLQTGEKWVACDPETVEGRSIVDGDLVTKYRERFGNAWVQARERNGQEEIRLKPLSEYRHHLEEPGRFLLMTGEETTTAWGSAAIESTNWINAFNIPVAIPPPRVSRTSIEAMRKTFRAAEAMERATKQPVLVSLNHPNWNWNATAENIVAVRELRFMEIHTALSSCRNDGDDQRASVERMWDIILTHRLGEMGGNLVYGLATDDCHAYAHDHHVLGDWALPGRAWVTVRSKHLTPEHILAAMHDGDFYSSSGVTLSRLDVDGKGIQLGIEAEDGVRYVTRFIGTRTGYDPSSTPVTDDAGQPLRTTRKYSPDIGTLLAEVEGPEPSYRFTGDELYVRAVITSDAPHPNPHRPGDVRKAWTQPVVPA